MEIKTRLSQIFNVLGSRWATKFSVRDSLHLINNEFGMDIARAYILVFDMQDYCNRQQVLQYSQNQFDLA